MDPAGAGSWMAGVSFVVRLLMPHGDRPHETFLPRDSRRLSHLQRAATPLVFRDVLLDLARGSGVSRAMRAVGS